MDIHSSSLGEQDPGEWDTLGVRLQRVEGAMEDWAAGREGEDLAQDVVSGMGWRRTWWGRAVDQPQCLRCGPLI